MVGGRRRQGRRTSARVIFQARVCLCLRHSLALVSRPLGAGALVGRPWRSKHPSCRLDPIPTKLEFSNPSRPSQHITFAWWGSEFVAVAGEGHGAAFGFKRSICRFRTALLGPLAQILANLGGLGRTRQRSARARRNVRDVGRSWPKCGRHVMSIKSVPQVTAVGLARGRRACLLGSFGPCEGPVGCVPPCLCC